MSFLPADSWREVVTAPAVHILRATYFLNDCKFTMKKKVEVKSFYSYTINSNDDFGILCYWIYSN